jgi:hypothetical protein
MTLTFKFPFPPRYRFYGSLLLWLGGYLIIKAYFLGRHPLLGNPYTYLTISELTFLFLLIFVAHKFAYRLRNFEQAVQNISFAGSNKIQNLERAADRIQDEMFRSRH